MCVVAPCVIFKTILISIISFSCFSSLFVSVCDAVAAVATDATIQLLCIDQFSFSSGDGLAHIYTGFRPFNHSFFCSRSFFHFRQ